jgi:hypothetical protein
VKIRMLEDVEFDHVTLKKHKILEADYDLAFSLVLEKRAEPTDLDSPLEEAVRDYAEYMKSIDMLEEEDFENEEDNQSIIL